VGDDILKILICGAGGQLGRALMDVAVGHHMLALTRAELDVTDADAVESAIMGERPDAVINAAAFTDVDGCEADPERAQRTNTVGAINVARSSLRAQAHLIHISTDYVFDGRKGRPYTEDDQPNPIQSYGRTKFEGERVVSDGRGRSCVMRTSWLYDLKRPGGFVAAVLGRAEAGDSFDVVADQIGTPTTTTVAARACLELVEHRMEGVVHRAGSEHMSRAEFARRVLAEAGHDPDLVRETKTPPPQLDQARRPRDTSMESIRPTIHRGPAGAAEDCDC
jgi:dTDP-4-dehydrorhamnose reductase